ncbi:MAG: outer membrane beta-barrel protein [Verrucomicrobiota bacterium]
MNTLKFILPSILVIAFSSSSVAGDFHTPIDSGIDAKAVYEAPNKFYAFGYGGGSFVDDELGLVNDTIPLLLELDDGYTVGGGVGVRTPFLGGFRFELEGFFGENDVVGGAINGNSGPFSNATGSLETYGFQFNMVKEFDFGGFKPYIGGGIGFTEVSAEAVAYGPINFTDNDGAFAWQAIAGVEFPVSENVGIYVEYNYHSVGDVAFQRSATTVLSFDDLTSSSVQAGVRISF